MKKISKTTKWVVPIMIALLGLIGAGIKFVFMYDRGLEEKFVTQEVYNLQIEIIKEDITEVKEKVNNMSAQQQTDSRKLDRALVILENQ